MVTEQVYRNDSVKFLTRTVTSKRAKLCQFCNEPATILVLHEGEFKLEQHWKHYTNRYYLCNVCANEAIIKFRDNIRELFELIENRPKTEDEMC